MWKLKIDDKGNVVLSADGHPIYIKEDGSEFEAKVYDMYNLTGTLRTEARTHREAKETAEQKLSAYGDLTADAAKEAVSKLSLIDQKKLIDAGQVETVKTEISKQYESQLAEEKKRASEAMTKYNSLVKSNAFSRSKFVADKVGVPVDMFEKMFENHFEVGEDGTLKATMNGNPVYSEKNIGNLATFDEALEQIVNHYPHKDSILKGANGTGGGGGGGTPVNGQRRYTRAEFDAKTHVERAQISKDCREGKAVISD